MNEMKAFLETVVERFRDEVSIFRTSQANADNCYQVFIDKVGGSEKLSYLLMGLLNLLYDNFDVDFFKRYPEPSLIYHIHKNESKLKELINALYEGRIDSKDFYIYKLRENGKEKVEKALELFSELGKIAPKVYEVYGKKDAFEKIEDEINGKGFVVRQVKIQAKEDIRRDKRDKEENLSREVKKRLREVEESKKQVRNGIATLVKYIVIILVGIGVIILILSIF